MDKTRLINLSDGTFAIILTLLVFDIRVPDEAVIDSNASFLLQLAHLSPLFIAYVVSFAVLVMFWMSHNFFYEYLDRTINRLVILLNMLFLATLAFIPFTARLLGEHTDVPLVVAVYGLNVFLIGFVFNALFEYALAAKDIHTDAMSSRIRKQSRIRRLVTMSFSLLGIALSFVSIPFALACYAFPIVFNVIPGSLNTVERLLGIELK